MRPGYVYIMASARNGTIDVGVTSDLIKRVWEHREGVVPGFTRQHRCKLLVWYEAYDDIQDARSKERRMKKWNRQWKLTDIERMNPTWQDLYLTLFG